MSGPKAGNYTVVSPEELRRRRLASARDRYERAAASVEFFRAELAGHSLAFGDLKVVAPRAVYLHSPDPEEWEDAADRLLATLEGSRTELATAVEAARIRRNAESGSFVAATLVDDAPAVRNLVLEPKIEEQLERILGRLPAEASPETVERCARLEQDIRGLQPGAHSDRSLDALRLVVQREQDRLKQSTANRRRLEELYCHLDGLAGANVERTRGWLKALPPDQPLPEDCEARVLAVRQEAIAAEDREYVLRAASEALEELGYEVGEGFETAVPGEGALVSLPRSGPHGLLVRERQQKLMLNVVRFDEEGHRDPRSDTAAEASFCKDFDRLRKRLESRGVELTMSRTDAPGATPVQVVTSSGRERKRRREQEATGGRERSL